MPIVNIRFNDDLLLGMLYNFEDLTGRKIPDLVRQHARLCCVELANRTQPFGVGSGNAAKAKALGENAVEAGITSILPRTSFFQTVADSTEDDKIRQRLQSLVAGGQWRAFVDVMKSLGMWKEVELISKSEFSATHKKHRNKRTGKTYSLRGKVYVPSGNVDTFIRKIQKRVGFSKAGWADCARQIKGVKGDGARGIPAFAKASRHGTNGKIKDNTKDKHSPHITMTNFIPWASRVCPRMEQNRAAQIAADKMEKAIMRAINEAKREKRKANA